MVTIQPSPPVRFSGVKSPAADVRFGGRQNQPVGKTEYILDTVLTNLEEKVRVGDTAGVQNWLDKDGLKLRALDPAQWGTLDLIWNTVANPNVDRIVTGLVVKNLPRDYRRQKLHELLEGDAYEPAGALKNPNYGRQIEDSNRKLVENLKAYREQAEVRQGNVENLTAVLEGLKDEQLITLQQETINGLQGELDQLNQHIARMETRLQQEKNRPQRLDKERTLKECLEKGNLDLLADYGYSNKVIDKPSKLIQLLSLKRTNTLRELGQLLTGRGTSKPSTPEEEPVQPGLIGNAVELHNKA